MNPNCRSKECVTSARRIFDAEYNRICVRTDRMFGFLLVAQWCAGMLIAAWLSPYTWSGGQRSTHLHMHAAVFLGGAITVLPVALAHYRPGQASTRYVIGVAQVLWSGLFIHLTGGRLETHFHIFGSLACLAFYRDFRVLLPATVVVATDHFVRGVVWPESIYGVLNPEWWRFLEHGAWVVFIDAFLVVNCLHARRDLSDLAKREAALLLAAETLEAKVANRTQELAERNGELNDALHAAAWSEALNSSVLDTADEAILTLSETGEMLSANPTARAMFEGDAGEISHIDELTFMNLGGEPIELPKCDTRVEMRALGGSGDELWLSARCLHIEVAQRRVEVVFLRDITAVRNADARAQHLHDQLVRQSRLAGMAEMATGVLHNVGNVLNSVNVAANTTRESIRASGGGHIARLLTAAERKHGGLENMVAANGASVTQLLGKIAQRLDAQRDTALDELTELQEHVDHIKAVIAKQQGYAKGSNGWTEIVTPEALLDDALALMKASLTRHTVEVRVKHDNPAMTCRIDRHRVLQVLVNLISNGRDALKDVTDRSGFVTIHTGVREGQVFFKVSDNGVGIDPEQADRVFTHGFTTKASGHGFGLHNCAIAAADMGGSLTFESEGADHGAAFTLSIPRGEAKAAA